MRPQLLLPALLLLPPVAVPAQQSEDPAIPVAGQDVPVPKRTKFVEPDYPEEARSLGQRGIVILEVVIDEQGKVASAQVVRSVPPFDEAALASVRHWEYEVTKQNGKPVKVRHTFPITFTVRLPEVKRQEGIPELRQGVAPSIPPGPLNEIQTVTAEVTLEPDGSVAQAQIRSGVAPWSVSVLEAVRTWRFVPGTEDGILSFRLQADFVPGRPAKVLLQLTSPRRSVSYPAVPEAPAVAAAPPEARAPETSAPTAEPSSAPEPSPPAPGGPPAAQEPATTPPEAQEPTPRAEPTPPPTEVLPGPVTPPATAPPPAPVSTEPGVSAVRDVTLGVGVPDLVKGRRPVPPPLARMAGTVGSVEVRFTVDGSGGSSVLSSDGPDYLKPAAADTVGSWQFRRTSTERMFLLAVIDYRPETAAATVTRQP
jgi:TonB family protein